MNEPGHMRICLDRAKMIGVPHRHISEMENGKGPHRQGNGKAPWEGFEHWIQGVFAAIGIVMRGLYNGYATSKA